MNNLNLAIENKTILTTGLNYGPLAILAAKYSGFYNRVVLNSEKEINQILEIFRGANLHMHVSLNELNMQKKESAKMLDLERAVAKNFNNATVDKITVWSNSIIFPAHFYFDEKTKSFLFVIKTEMRAIRTGLNRDFDNYVRVRFIKTLERDNRSLDELLSDAKEVFTAQFKEHLNSTEQKIAITESNKQIDNFKVEEKAKELFEQPTIVAVETAVEKTVKHKVTLEEVYAAVILQYPTEKYMYESPEVFYDEVLSFYNFDRTDFTGWELKLKNYLETI